MAVAGRLAAAEVARPRTPLERAWLRAAALARRARPAAVVAGVLLALGAGARAIQVASRPPLCRASQSKLAGVWDAGTKAAVRAAFAATGRSYAGEVFANVDRLLDGYVGAWAAMYTEACEATHVRGEQSDEILDLRMACLQDRLGGARALSELYARADGSVVDNAVDAANALGPLERCADARLLRAVLPPPENVVARREVERIRGGLAGAKALHDAGNDRLAAERLKAIVAGARAVRHGPVLAEALELLGRVESDLGDSAAAQAALKEAFFQAEAARHDEIKASAATFLVLTSSRHDRAEADDWALQADATLRRIGGHDRMRSWLESHLGELRRVQGRNEEALAHLRQAVELKESSGAGRGDVARSLNNMGLVLEDMGRLTEATATVERAIADLGREVGAEHPVVATYMSNDGEILARLGRQAEARAAFERALAIEERAYGKESTNLAYPLEGLGESHLADHDAAAAVAPLERALRIREAHESDRALVAESAFALARALWEAGRDRPRAEHLAAEARAIYAAQPTAAARLADVDRWIGGARGGSSDAVTAAR
jgi:tetratricopeptide (TPR) repeat protein